MKTEKKKAIYRKSEEMMDHFLRLPEEGIVHHILSFLPAKDVTATSVLSKTWYKWFYSFPYLESDWKYDSKCQSKNDFLNLVELSLRRRLQQLSSTNTQVHRFSLWVIFDDLDLLRPCVDRLLDMAVRGNVADLALCMDISPSVVFRSDPYLVPHYDVPQPIFLVKTLTILSLCRCALGDNFVVKLPQLRMLQCHEVDFGSDILMFENLADSCPRIEHIDFLECTGITRIRSVTSLPQLKVVELHKCDEEMEVDILAPNLLLFSFDNEFGNFNLETSVILKKLLLRETRVNVSLRKLMPELEVLRLRDCELSGNIDIPIKHLKELHIEFRRREDVVVWSKWKDFLMSLSIAKDIKLVLPDNENIIIHDNLSEVSLSSLDQLHDLEIKICFSSWSYSEILDDILCINNETLSIVSVNRSEDLPLNTMFKREYQNSVLDGYEVESSQVTKDEMDAHLKRFLEDYSTGGYSTTTCRLKWKVRKA